MIKIKCISSQVWPDHYRDKEEVLYFNNLEELRGASRMFKGKLQELLDKKKVEVMYYHVLTPAWDDGWCGSVLYELV